jgi:prepilin-type N-terminal cleavage/methylation domain-containing protein
MTSLGSARRRSPSTAHPRRHRTGFTLVEMLVVLVILSVLASLSLAGLAGASLRGKIEKTKSTIRKLNEIVTPQYEGYLRRRVSFTLSGTGVPAAGAGEPFDSYTNTLTGSTFGPRPPSSTSAWPAVTGTNTRRAMAQSRLQKLRALMIYEMPDSWADVRVNTTSSGASSVPPFLLASGTFAVPPSLRTGPVRAYAAYLNSFGGVTGTATPPVCQSLGMAECLHMIVSRSLYEPSVMEQFRSDEIGDSDKDGAPEFIDAWSQPILFIRWAPAASSPLAPGVAGLNSPLQICDRIRHHDPFDPNQVDVNGFALYPMIISMGPDQTFGLTSSGTAGTSCWSAGLSNGVTTGTSLLSLRASSGASPGTVTASSDSIGATLVITGTPCGAVDALRPTAYFDNITNHDLIKK